MTRSPFQFDVGSRVSRIVPGSRPSAPQARHQRAGLLETSTGASCNCAPPLKASERRPLAASKAWCIARQVSPWFSTDQSNDWLETFRRIANDDGNRRI